MYKRRGRTGVGFFWMYREVGGFKFLIGGSSCFFSFC